MGLCIIDVKALELYRKMITEVTVGDLMYNTYPKDVLNHGTEVSLYLRAELKALDLEFIPYSLFEKNRMLDGSVAVRYSKDVQSKEEQSTAGGGKLVILEGDKDFCRSIHNYSSNHHFRLGTSSVKLRYEEYGKEFLSPVQPQPDQVLQPQQQPDLVERNVAPPPRIDSSDTSPSTSSTPSSSGSEVRLVGSRTTRARWKKNEEFPIPVPARRKSE